MKKFIVILVAIIGFGLSATAQSSCAVKVEGVTIGAIVAWTEDGYLWVSNDTDRQVTVTIEVEGGMTYTVVVPPTPKGQSAPPTKAKTGIYSKVIKVYNAICQ